MSAGVVAEALLGLLAAVYLPRAWLVSASLTERIVYYGLVFTVLFAVIDVVHNLTPRDVTIDGEVSPNDGKILRQLWRNRHGLAAGREAFLEQESLNAALNAGDDTKALQLAQRTAARHPDIPVFAKLVGELQARLGQIDRACETWQQALQIPNLAPSAKAQFLDNLSCLPLYHDRPDYLDRAERWIDEAIRLDPAAITLKGTRGGILVEIGRLNEGAALLQHVIQESKSGLDQAISSAYLAKTLAAQGQRAEANERFAHAHALHPEHPVIVRIGRELASHP